MRYSIPPVEKAVLDIMFDYAGRRKRMLSGKKLAHYTTAENALSIIGGEQIWLRNATVMNDFSEMEHGRACLDHAVQGPTGDRMRRVVDAAHEGAWREVTERIKEHQEAVLKKTFMVSLCEHDVCDRLGKLSMWRAYGGPTSGAALILNTHFISDIVSGLPVYPSPVLYADAAGFESQMRKVVEKMEAGIDALRRASRTFFVETVRRALMFAIMSCKHLGFKEEEEWRLIYLPEMGEDNALIAEAAESIRGVPQIVHKLPLRSDPLLGDISLASLIHQVIIGPTLHPEIVRDAVEHSLRSKGVQGAAGKILLSDIPLRQWG